MVCGWVAWFGERGRKASWFRAGGVLIVVMGVGGRGRRRRGGLIGALLGRSWRGGRMRGEGLEFPLLLGLLPRRVFEANSRARARGWQQMRREVLVSPLLLLLCPLRMMGLVMPLLFIQRKRSSSRSFHLDIPPELLPEVDVSRHRWFWRRLSQDFSMILPSKRWFILVCLLFEFWDLLGLRSFSGKYQ